MLNKQEIKEIQNKTNPTQDELALCEAFRILGDWNRYRITKVLLQTGELCVSDLAAILKLSMSATSQHLRILEISGMVESERMGQMICYRPRLTNQKLKTLVALLETL